MYGINRVVLCVSGAGIDRADVDAAVVRRPGRDAQVDEVTAVGKERRQEMKLFLARWIEGGHG